ncbi:MAG: hypothetical protein C0425_10510 [Chlorobiaceae bacterium]|nr:hypothetical protein [Chlorobiaceae bacterium]MBA4310749.1 hypothetical protein [Chlorobiaceae bacterium]
MKILKYVIILIFTFLLIPEEVLAQLRITERGTFTYRKVGIHRGNQVRTIFSNYGVIAQPGDQGPRGAWKFDANGYVGDVSPIVAVRLPIMDLNNDGRIDTAYSAIVTPVSRPGGGDFGPGGQFWGFEPIPGFANETLNEPGKGVAMSNQPETWPSRWPDFPTWNYTGEPIIVGGVDKTPLVDWNGYFGRGQISADQESYFWMDDHADQKMFTRWGFRPDSQDTNRRGQGLQVNVRGLQWSNFLAQNVIFWLYNIKNDGTTNYDQASFGTLVGTYVGADGDEWNDDASFFDIRESITYTFDYEPGGGGRGFIRPSANPRWQPNPTQVGYIAYAFLESPGNPFDGIDNDADNTRAVPSLATRFQSSDFNNQTLRAGDRIVLINKDTYARTLFTIPAVDSIQVTSLGVNFLIRPGITIVNEGNADFQNRPNPNAFDGIDNDFDGLIDENQLVHLRQYKVTAGTPPIVLIDLLNPLQYTNKNDQGRNDRMIDEARDNGIDEDNDWNILTDDVGLDGKAGTGDFGENDGRASSGFQINNLTGKLEDTGFPGEPNIDKTDVDESDQLGLTSFQYFVPANNITMSNEEDMWRRLVPGFFDVPSSVVNNVPTRGEDGDFMYGSGYFPLLAGKTERFSLALVFGDDLPAIIKTKQIAQMIYNANYNFPRPPEKPTLTVVPGDGKVTLYWDRVAEESIDPVTKEKDFEGYKIFKGTDPDFTDALQITDGTGQKVFHRPIVQFDLKNGISGYFLSGPTLYSLTNGAPYYLGNETGIVNSYVDSDVMNGRTYYYAVVAYDRGRSDRDIFPSENTKFVSKDIIGNISTDKNTAWVIPNAPVLGYVPPTSGVRLERVTGASTAVPFFEVIDPSKVKNATYNVTFKDTIIAGVSFAQSYTVKDSTNNIVLTALNPRLFPSNGDVFDGFRLSFDTSFQKIDSINLDNRNSGWRITSTTATTPKPPSFSPLLWDFLGVKSTRFPADYAFVFSDTYRDSSNDLTHLLQMPAPSNPRINFQVYDVTDKKNPKKIKFFFFEGLPEKQDTLSTDDVVVLSDPTGTKLSWYVFFTDTNTYVPRRGDTLMLSFFKPISGNDRFTFTTNRESFDVNNVKDKLDRIKAVPNPYVVTNVFEQPLAPQLRGRGERIMNFVHVPPFSKIHIYTSSGNHIRTLEHDGTLGDGSVTWDLRTKEGLDVAFGVYFYVVELDGLSDKKYGKIAIIK